MATRYDAPDTQERLRAIDPSGSFIVQAPAGSGKTGLLIQRYLRLLACVNHPEEIVAITFTRKAAAEMRERVLHALEKVAGGKPLNAETAFDRLTGQLARDVLKHDRQAGWHLADNPMRLRIQTIDALCASLTRQMPILSHFGSQPETVENAQALYLEAARTVVASLDQDSRVAEDVAILLDHLDNDIVRVENLLATMLARRDHWLRHVHGRTREELESSLENLRRSVVDRLCALFSEKLSQEMLVLLRYAVANLLTERRVSPIVACDCLDKLPSTVDQWCGIAELLLKADGDWRSRVDIRQGFPSGQSKEEKESAKVWKMRFAQLIGRLRAEPLLQRALQEVRKLPPPAYSETQWRILGAITRLLPHTVSQLKVIFQLTGQVDFTEVMQSALTALGEDGAPTDLALVLDYRIQHILVDEFQDTSISQYRLIEKLVAEWLPDDGRSLFVVGDPMQSIYRFREAEVGLFLQARQVGIGPVVLQPITLNSNFRSQHGIVDWVNTAFKSMMPAAEDITAGAVTYTPSIAVHDALQNPAVTVHPVFDKNRSSEADRVLEVVLQSRQRYPENVIAVLVRSRSHLIEIVPRLQLHGLRFSAVEISALDQKPVVQDLLALTRALYDPVDRLAWLSVLRAPWCGMRLDDLQALLVMHSNDSVNQKSLTMFELISDSNYWQDLSYDGIQRLQRISAVMMQCITNRCRQSLRATVEAAWHALGGPGCLHMNNKTLTKHIVRSDMSGEYDTPINNAFNDVATFLAYLEQHEFAGSIVDWETFESGLSRLFATTDVDADHNLHIMTIHKAKGLEFDTVLVPGLGYASKNMQRQLLRWVEQPRNNLKTGAVHDKFGGTGTDLYLAPIQKTGEQTDAINDWLESLEREQEDYEAVRLLYVAATRARKFLHLFGYVSVREQKDSTIFNQPRSGSLLKRLWPVVEPIYNSAIQTSFEGMGQETEIGAQQSEVVIDQSILRFKADWKLPEAPQPIRWQQYNQLETEIKQHEKIEFSWASEMAKHVGSIVHYWLQKIAEDKLENWHKQRIQSMRKRFADGLLQNGLSAGAAIMEQAVARIVIALTHAITDQRGRWILGEQQNAKNEYKLTGLVEGKLVEYVIDRIFYDDQGTLWIIDYKTSSHEGAGIELFLDSEQRRYRYQLDNYAKLYQKIEKDPIRLGLYFPILKGWRTWEYEDNE